MTRIVVVGAGAVGARVARQLVSGGGVEVAVADERPEVSAAVARSLGDQVDVIRTRAPRSLPGSHPVIDPDADAIVICTRTGHHLPWAEQALRASCPVVTVADSIDEVRSLLHLDDLARARGVPLVVGAGFSPGLTCVLARLLGDSFDVVEEVHVAKAGTGGPSCARQHHSALKSTALDWRDGAWVRRPGGSGRELCWFPSPVDGRDCYRAALPDGLLLVPVFEGVQRVTARMWATRRDRLTMHLPMLRPPHPEGLAGAVRVEVRGRRAGAHVIEVMGCVASPAVGAAAVAAAAVVAAAGGANAPGARGLATLDDPRGFVRGLTDRGVRIEAFEGLPTAHPPPQPTE